MWCSWQAPHRPHVSHGGPNEAPGATLGWLHHCLVEFRLQQASWQHRDTAAAVPCPMSAAPAADAHQPATSQLPAAHLPAAAHGARLKQLQAALGRSVHHH
jgi:hypothetical protein